MTTAATTAISFDDAKDEAEPNATPGFMGLLEQFMQEGFEDPDRFDRIPKGAVLVILPTDDPKLAARERAKADQMAAQGRTVHIEAIGPRRPAPPPWWLGERAPGNLRALLPVAESLLNGTGLIAVFDPSRDLLLVSERRGEQQGLAWPLTRGISALVDISTNRGFAFIVPDFVTDVIPRRPHLAFMLTLAELRPLRQENVGDFELPAAHETEVTVPARPDALSAEDRDRLIEAFRQLTGEADARCIRTQFFQSDDER